jgi:hypothetical protein
MSKLMRTLLITLAFCSYGAAARAAATGYTLLVAPSRYSVMQVAFDVVQRNPAVLVSYQGDSSSTEPLLHAWNGQEWVHISLQDFREVSFLEKVPGRTVLIGDDKTLPAELASAASWSPEIVRISSLTTSSLVNEFGRLFKWSPSEWKWFANRFHLDLTDESEPLRKTSWYDQPGPLYRPPLKDAIKEDHHRDIEPSPAPIMDSSYQPPVAPVTSYEVETSPTDVEDVEPAATEVPSPTAWSAPASVGSETIQTK